jgi:small subunit ribosomal protein S16
MGRKNRPFYRLCSVDSRNKRDGKVIEELGYYDPMVSEVDARAVLKGERIDYWLSVGAQPSEAARVLIRKYGSKGTHLAAQQAALARLSQRRVTMQQSALNSKYEPPKRPAKKVEAEAAPAEEAAAE